MQFVGGSCIYSTLQQGIGVGPSHRPINCHAVWVGIGSWTLTLAIDLHLLPVFLLFTRALFCTHATPPYHFDAVVHLLKSCTALVWHEADEPTAY
jgi:hypothetical protein